MSKTIIIIGVVLGAILIAGVILSLVAPKRITITCSEFIKAPKEQVYDQIRFLRNFPNWSPFKAQDPDQKHFISGQDGEIGATFSWEGVKEKSKGSQKIVSLVVNEKIELICDITEPFQANPKFTYTIKQQNESVEVTQHFDLALPFPNNIFGLIFGLKKEIKSTNQTGLHLLKKACEK
ncbi:MAG: SRPBCC family protein [Flavobacteriales bacterium]|jgi:hypothetical protein